jgi:multiple sugar transport system substrate-binding protein
MVGRHPQPGRPPSARGKLSAPRGWRLTLATHPHPTLQWQDGAWLPAMRKPLWHLLIIACLWALGLGTQPLLAQARTASQTPAPAQATLPQGAVSLTFWCSPYPAEVGWAIQMTRLFNATHPGIRVRLQAFPSGRVAEDVLRDAIRTKTTPDVTTHLFPADVREFARLGGLLPLDGFGSLLAVVRKRSGAQVDRFRSDDGHLYQLPWKCNPIMLAYNATLLRKLGLRVPSTYSQLLAAAKTLREREHIYAWALNPTNKWWKRYYDFYPLYLAASAGAGLLDSKGLPAPDLAAATAVLELAAASFGGDLAPSTEQYPSDAALNEAFVSNRLAFLITGPWNIPQLQEAGGAAFDFGFVPLPVPDAMAASRERCTYGNFRNVGIFTTCKHPAEAACFVEFLLSRASDRAFVEMCSELPYRVSLSTDPELRAVLAQHRHLDTFAAQLSRVRSVEAAGLFGDMLELISGAWVDAAVRRTKEPRAALEGALAEARRRAQVKGP